MLISRSRFNDPDSLLETIDKGQMFGKKLDSDPFDVTDVVKKALFANAIRMAWMSGEHRT